MTYNKYMKSIFLLLSVLSINLSFTQNDYATIYISRPKVFTIASQDVKIEINDQVICNLSNGSALEYKVFNIGQIKIIGSCDVMNYKGSTNINVQKNKIYYINLKARWPRLQGFDFEVSDESIMKKIPNKNLIKLSDIGILNSTEIEKSDTDWTYDNLIEHWTKDGISDIEGIYERVSSQIEYRLAVLKEKNEYKIIYLAGARGTGWKEGDIKATLRKTAQFGIFKSNWFMLNKAYNKDINVIFESASMKTLSEAGDNSQDLYLKMYPTYDNDVNSSTKIANTNNWKSSGTGFFIDKKGYLATNYHVIKGAKTIEIVSNGKPFKAKVEVSDEQNDLAILKIDDNSFVPLTNINYNFKTESSEVGTSVFALGFPMTQIMGEEIKFTDGKINAKSGYKGEISTYQISVPIQPGNSGGPLFDNDGNLVGITSSGLDKSLTDNVNYAIKTKYLNLLIEEINDKIELPKTVLSKTTLLTEKIKILSNYVVYIKVK
jgi:S1-C subfamily serine protease